MRSNPMSLSQKLFSIIALLICICVIVVGLASYTVNTIMGTSADCYRASRQSRLIIQMQSLFLEHETLVLGEALEKNGIEIPLEISKKAPGELEGKIDALFQEYEASFRDYLSFLGHIRFSA